MTTTDTPTFIPREMGSLAGYKYQLDYAKLREYMHIELAGEFERLKINYKDVTILRVMEILAKTKNHNLMKLGSCQAFLCKLYLSWLATGRSNDSELQEFIGLYDFLCIKMMSHLDDSVDHLNSNTYNRFAKEVKRYKDFGKFVHSTSYALRCQCNRYGHDPREVTILLKSSEYAEESFYVFGLDTIGVIVDPPVQIDYSDYKIMKLLRRR